ncbi:coiled-coil domain-containing protein 25 isoform X2 [Ovis aries]|uniref:coiled-coil domain-containing protein 25 isoform X2 n=1 Tax=Ovis aries TaxID=9940 RepID=UPI002952833D|nr:coiled-coil domain-containing protein 25 isoform X2 [Ovis aries]
MKVSFQKHLILKFSADEDLIKYGWPEDIWFHVDKLSSAHVYLRLHKGEKIEDIPKEVLMDCAHLVKANSIQGCKMNNVNVVYTPWSNLKKTADMDVGQIGFHRQKDVKIVTVEKKVNEILNRLEKTKMERFPDLEAEKECRDHEERNEKKAQIQEMKRREKEEMKKKREMDELRSYSSLMKAENMSSNQVAKVIKNPPANAGDTRDVGLIPGLGGSPGGRNSNPLQHSCLENPMDRGAWQAAVHGVAKSWTQLST